MNGTGMTGEAAVLCEAERAKEAAVPKSPQQDPIPSCGRKHAVRVFAGSVESRKNGLCPLLRQQSSST